MHQYCSVYIRDVTSPQPSRVLCTCVKLNKRFASKVDNIHKWDVFNCKHIQSITFIVLGVCSCSISELKRHWWGHICFDNRIFYQWCAVWVFISWTFSALRSALRRQTFHWKAANMQRKQRVGWLFYQMGNQRTTSRTWNRTGVILELSKNTYNQGITKNPWLEPATNPSSRSLHNI